MIVFLSSSPCVPDADRAILNPANGFVDRLWDVVPPAPKCLFVCSDPDSPELTDRFAGDMAQAFAEADMEFGDLAVLDGRNPVDAGALVAWSDLIILAGGHVPTQNRFFQQIRLAELLVRLFGVNPKAQTGEVSEDEILLMVGEGEETGAIGQDEKELIENILEFDDRTA